MSGNMTKSVETQLYYSKLLSEDDNDLPCESWIQEKEEVDCSEIKTTCLDQVNRLAASIATAEETKSKLFETEPSASKRNNTTPSSSDRKVSLANSTGSNACRICLESDASSEPLVTPCLCTGSSSYVHITCLKKWLMTSGSTVCELCLYELDVGWKVTPLWKSISLTRPTNKKVCMGLLICIAALTLPLFCVFIFVLDDGGMRLRLDKPTGVALSYAVIFVSCVAYLALLFLVMYLAWRWKFCLSASRCRLPTELEIRVETLEERIKRGRRRRSGNTRSMLANPDATDEMTISSSALRRDERMDQYWMIGEGYM